jgi:large subunit ribosomal protein L25
LEPGARVRIAIPVRFRGQENSPGLKLGGVINVVRHEIEIYCSADNIPDYIEGDLDGLEIGDSLHINDFKLPEGTKTVIQRNFTVASIAPPTTFVEETPVAAAGEAGDWAADRAIPQQPSHERVKEISITPIVKPQPSGEFFTFERARSQFTE